MSPTIPQKTVKVLQRRLDYLTSLGTEINSYDQAEMSALKKVISTAAQLQVIEKTLGVNLVNLGDILCSLDSVLETALDSEDED